MEFSFNQADLFAALVFRKGNVRRSVVGMFKSCNSIETAIAIGNFLKKNNLGGWTYRITPMNNVVCYIYLNKTNENALWILNKTKLLKSNLVFA